MRAMDRTTLVNMLAKALRRIEALEKRPLPSGGGGLGSFNLEHFIDSSGGDGKAATVSAGPSWWQYSSGDTLLDYAYNGGPPESNPAFLASGWYYIKTVYRFPSGHRTATGIDARGYLDTYDSTFAAGSKPWDRGGTYMNLTTVDAMFSMSVIGYFVAGDNFKSQIGWASASGAVGYSGEGWVTKLA